MDNIVTIIKFIDENIENHFDIIEIAKDVNFSVSHLQKVFKNKTGYPIMKYVKAAKLQYGAGLLAATDKRVCDIALEIGFEHEQSFIRALKKQYGIPPGRYRTAIRKND